MREVVKSYQSEEITDRQLEEINRQTRRALTREEVYVFAVNLCDNDLDRDGERFTDKALDRLAELFVGRTGIFDHDPKGRNQTARIFCAQAQEQPGRLNRLGQPYRVLRAMAYMVRSEKNADLMLEIDAGIKKEVSVSCAVAKRRCSICAADLNAGGCDHRPGQTYEGKLCCVQLEDPTDAYEWSFVAVPAQPGAGVTKAFGSDCGAPVLAEDCTVAQLAKGLEEGAVLSLSQGKRLSRHLEQMERLSKAGESYLEELRRDYVRLSCALCPGLEGDVARQVARRLELEQLTHCCKALERQAGQACPAIPQLGGPKQEEGPAMNRSFRL